MYTLDISHSNSLDYTEEDSISGIRRMLLIEEQHQNDLVHVDFNSVKTFPFNQLKSIQEDSVFKEKSYNNTMCIDSMFGVLVFAMNGNFENNKISQLSLSLESIIDIYLGNIKYWDDSRIVNENPNIILPSNQLISVLSRSSTSGTSLNLLNYLATLSSDFNQKFNFLLSNPTSKIRNLNLTSLTTNSNLLIPTNKDMLEYLKNMKGSFGYTSLNVYSSLTSEQKSNVILINLIINGKSIVPSLDNAKNTISKFASSTFKSSDIYSQSLSISKSNENHYPLITCIFWCFRQYQSLSEDGVALLQFFTNSYKYLQSSTPVTTTTTTTLETTSTATTTDMIMTTSSSVKNALRMYFKRQQSTSEGSLSGVIALPSWLSSNNLKIIEQTLMCEKKLCSTIPKPTNEYVTLFLQIALPLLIVMGCCVMILLIGIAIYCIRKRRFKSPSQLNQQLLQDQEIEYMEDSTTVASTYTFTPKLFEKEQLKSTIRTEELSLDEQIGSGSFSEVYRGRWLGATVAVKRFLVNHIESDEIVQDFIKESKLMSKLRHPNVVQFMGVCIQMPHLYMVTEYCERGNLQHILKDKKIKISLRKTISMALDAARGMYYLHTCETPIIHRDFKSANLLVDKNWSVKVGDFGMSRMIDSQQQMTVCGTAETCAPEVLKRSMYTEKADVYSFGIVLWEMFTRSQLYPGMNFYELSSRVVNEGLRPDTTSTRFTEDHIPKTIQNLMTDCWDDDPDHRPDFSIIVKKLEKELEIENQKKNKD
ncbi:serine/threonine protein kinase [Naegleria gruberi]|uniref:non-specific serine/threonine protein kinase n=1 Tax=Naegleria gruberi TaxID=5762 RepID=D2V8M2_NAEGR|nr:serine/threonine protein kinase [Naegleria gruberi]EFC46712.1 serine/threonine protein kinase [Naegleria gruberi]|eukprot:XP_002679456.1 serine/threonine protein kinase [Naegleria gruberi strain NEG-M]